MSDSWGDPIPPGHGERRRDNHIDIEVIVDSELMVAHIESRNENAADYIDAYMPGVEIEVVDSGRIILKQADTAAFIEAAEKYGFGVLIL